MNDKTKTIDARSDEAKMQEAIGLIVNCLMSVGVEAKAYVNASER